MSELDKKVNRSSDYKKEMNIIDTPIISDRLEEKKLNFENKTSFQASIRKSTIFNDQNSQLNSAKKMLKSKQHQTIRVNYI